MKNKAIFINNFSAGGAEKVAHNLLSEFSKEDLTYIIFLTKKNEYELPHNCLPIYLTNWSKLNRYFKIFLIPFFAFKLKEILIKNNIYFVMSFMNYTNWVASFVKILNWNGKLIINEQAAPLEEYNISTFSGKIGLFLIRILYPKANFIVSCSYGVDLQLKKIINKNLAYKVIYNPINIDKLKQQKEEREQVNYDKFTFVNVAGFRKQKNHMLLVEAFSELNDFDCQLLLIGNEYDFGSKIRKKVKDLNVRNKVKFIGFTKNPISYLMNSKCFVLSSDYEGLPNVILEALFCNLPIISTDCPTGPREILAPNTNLNSYLTNGIEIAEHGILTTRGDKESLVKGMKLLLSDKELANKFVEKSHYSTKSFELPIFVNKYKKLVQ